MACTFLNPRGVFNNHSFAPKYFCPALPAFSCVSFYSVKCVATKKLKKKQKVLTLDKVNQNLLKMEYTIMDDVSIRGHQHLKELKQGLRKPFSKVLFTNRGDSQGMGHPPITFLRQVLSACVYPSLLKSSKFPSDAVQRSQEILNGCAGKSMGAYTDSQGIYVVRKHIAEYITRRDDGIKSSPENILIMDGVSPIIMMLLSVIANTMDGKPSGVMIPCPSYPLYNAALTQFSMRPIEYNLNEDKNWSVDIAELQRAIDEAKNCCAPRVLVLINPGNPTGQVLSKRSIEDIIKFAHKEDLIIFADEIFQENVYDAECEFHSVKKVKHELGAPYNELELFSFMSVSKGYLGECGLRSGYVEVDSIHPDVFAVLMKASSVKLCANTIGQAAFSVLCKPPEPGDISYEEFTREKSCIMNGLACKATLIAQRINKIQGMKLNPVQGSVFALTKLDLPNPLLNAAKKKNVPADVLWATELLDSTGVVVVPGSAFRQKKDTYHFRTSILPSFEILEEVSDKLKKYQLSFHKKMKKMS